MQFLTLRGNKLKYLPPSIANLKSLYSLDVSDNDFTDLSSLPVLDIEKIEIIDITNNRLKHIPEFMLKIKPILFGIENKYFTEKDFIKDMLNTQKVDKEEKQEKIDIDSVSNKLKNLKIK